MVEQPPFQPVTPGPREVPELRARGVGEIIDAAFKLYLARWKLFIPLSAVFMVPFAALSAIASGTALGSLDEGEFVDPEALPTTQEVLAFFVPIAAVGLLFMLFYPVMSAALAWAAGRTYTGDSPSVGRTVGVAFGKIGPILLVAILTGLAIVGGFLLLIIPAIIFGIRFLLASQIVILEDTKAKAAMSRSWNLTRGYFWKIVGAMILSAIIGSIVQAIVSAPFQITAQFLLGENLVLGSVLMFIGDAIGGTLVTPFSVIVQVLVYFDLRIRKEGLDLSMMAQQLRP